MAAIVSANDMRSGLPLSEAAMVTAWELRMVGVIAMGYTVRLMRS